jgi:hypothetical protein
MAQDHISVEALIQGIQLDNPRLYQILQELNRGLMLVQDELFPLVLESQAPPAEVPIPVLPGSISFIFTPTTVRFNWTEVLGAYGYELRKGPSFEFGLFLFRIMSLQADIDALKVGTHEFYMKTLNSNGVFSTDSLSIVVTVPPIGTISLISTVIDNNVLLRWVAPVSTFRILTYEAYRNGIFAGNVDATFFSFFENVAGAYRYGIVSVDIAGNKGPLAETTVEVQTPPDYALQDTRVSGLNGTRVNVIRDPYIPSLIACWAPSTWEEHFVNFGFATIQAQVDAGYPIYIQPTATTGSYEEVIDYGVVIQNTIITVTWNFFVHQELTTIIVKLATSEDGVTYTPFVAGVSLYSPSMRYLKIRLEFTGTSDKALYELWNLTYSLSVKRENDGGEVNALLTDVGGTQVNFKKAFKDVESITCTTKSVTEPYTVIFDFTDVPNPVGFRVYVFDSTGNRVSRVVDWKARGII